MPRAKQLGWFFGIWALSVAALAIVGGVVGYTVYSKDPAISPPNGTLGSFSP